MSTRCNIAVRYDGWHNSGSTYTYIYHHCDGYPSGVGSDLKAFLVKHWPHDWQWQQYPELMIDDIMKGKVGGDDAYRFSPGLHGDIEYLYVIDTQVHTFKCYAMHYGDADEYKTVENIIAHCKEVEIPDPEPEEDEPEPEPTPEPTEMSEEEIMMKIMSGL